MLLIERLRPVDDDKISLIAYSDGRDGSPYLLLRTFYMGGPWFSLRGVHELCIQRENDSIQFKRWSRSENCSKLWATLRFQTWEGTPAYPEVLNLDFCC